jgi:hypothetical protein
MVCIFYNIRTINIKNNLITSAILASSLIFSSMTTFTASASDSDTTSNFHAGLKAGGFLTNLDEIDGGSGFGFQLGYNVTPTLSLDLEYTSGTLDATVANFDIDFDITTTAIYLTYRSTGDAYFLAKAGYLNEALSTSVEGFDISDDDSGASYGIGGGYRFSESFAVEIDYTVIEEDVSFIGLTAQFSF